MEIKIIVGILILMQAVLIAYYMYRFHKNGKFLNAFWIVFNAVFMVINFHTLFT